MSKTVKKPPNIVVCEYEAVEEKENSESNVNVAGYGFGARHQQTLLLFTCVTILCITRSCLSVAILAMTSKRTSEQDYVQTFAWDKATIGLIMSSFYWGELVTQFPAGIVICKHGGKPFISFVMIASGFIVMLIPFAADIGGWIGVCLCRIIFGAIQGFCYPSLHMLLGKWSPTCERNRFGNFIYSGMYIGTILTHPTTAFISASSLGWPFVFYIFGGLCFITGLVWLWCGANSPADHPSIHPDERNFIEESLQQNAKAVPLKTPWRAIMSSVPVWALMTAQVGAVWGFSVMLMETPSYFKLAFGIDLEESGLYSALPYVAAWFLTMFASFAADNMVNSGKVSLGATRKIHNTLGTWGSAVGMIALLFVPAESFSLAVFLVTIIIGMDGFNSSGFLLNHIDLTPNFAGVLVSIGNTLSDALIQLAPIATGLIVKDPTDVKQWRLVFLLAASIYFISNLVFIIFGSAERQSWDESKDEPQEEITSLKILDELVPKQKNSMLDLTDIVKNIEVY